MKAFVEVIELKVNDVVTTSNGGYDPNACSELDLPDF